MNNPNNLMLIQGFNGQLNLCITLKDTKPKEIQLLNTCKSFIENYASYPWPTNRVVWKRHPNWEIIQRIVEELMKLNDKSEYHYLYALIIRHNMRVLLLNSDRDEEQVQLMKGLIDKHYFAAYQLDHENPANIFYLIERDRLHVDILYSFHQIEIKLNDRTYRKKYNYVIDEL
eukprot:15490_1